MFTALIITSCVKESSKDTYYYCRKLSLECSKEYDQVTFYTSKGSFVVDLYYETNPLTVSNFLKNIQKEIYIGKRFYKILDFEDNKIIYSGIENNRYLTNLDLVDSLVTNLIPLEISLTGNSLPIYGLSIDDPIQLSRLINRFEPGTIAMVNYDKTSSSSTEFFLVTNKMPELDGRYSIFGKVINGLEILQELEKNDEIIDIKVF